MRSILIVGDDWTSSRRRPSIAPVITSHVLLLSTGPGPAILPRVERVAWERAEPRTYFHDSSHRPSVQAAIQVTLRGCGAIFLPSGEVQSEVPVGRALCFVSQRQRIRYGCHPDAREPWEFLYANLEGSAAIEAIAELGVIHGHVLPLAARHPTVRALARLIPQSEFTHRHLGAGVSARLAGDLIAALIDSSTAATGSDASLIDQAMTFLMAHLADPVGVAQVAEHCGVTREYLTRLFVRACGEAPAAWLRHQRLRHAGILLHAGREPLAEVARRCGFATSSHFIRAFSAYAGTTPARYRRG